MKFEYTNEALDELERAFSPERLARSYEEASGDREKGFQIYLQNIVLSEALYMPLQGLEILLRNALGGKLRERYGDEWFNNASLPFEYRQKVILNKAKAELAKRKVDVTHGRVIAELSYGFWTGILGRHYENNLWRPLFHTAFPNAPRPLVRKRVHGLLDNLRMLRNRIAHHEPITARDLEAEYRIIIELAEWISPKASQWIDDNSRFLAAVSNPSDIHLGEYWENYIQSCIDSGDYNTAEEVIEAGLKLLQKANKNK